MIRKGTKNRRFDKLFDNEIEHVITVTNLSKSFDAHLVFRNVNLTVRRGEILGLLGASGSGKSVLMRCLNGLEPYQSGVVKFYGRDIGKLKGREINRLDRRCGILFQDGALFSSLNVLQNIQVPLREHSRLPKHILNELALLKLSLVGLDGTASFKMPSELSGGMRKRAALARALALDPKILFLDEPTAGLDPIGASQFDKLILNLKKTLDLTVVMVTHDLDTIFKICDRVAVLADKTLIKEAAPLELVKNPGHPWIKDYFCGDRARAVLEQ